MKLNSATAQEAISWAISEARKRFLLREFKLSLEGLGGLRGQSKVDRKVFALTVNVGRQGGQPLSQSASA